MRFIFKPDQYVLVVWIPGGEPQRASKVAAVFQDADENKIGVLFHVGCLFVTLECLTIFLHIMLLESGFTDLHFFLVVEHAGNQEL